MNLCLRLNYQQFVRTRCVCGVFSCFLVVYFLSRKMATREPDFLAESITHEECRTSTWRLEPLSFARSERRCVTLHKRAMDDTLETTKFAIENLIALMVGDKLARKFSFRRYWEVDFVRFILGFTTALVERDFNKQTQDQNRLCSHPHSVTKIMGKAFTGILRHNSNYKYQMDQKGALPLNFLLDLLKYRSYVNPLEQHADGRLFATFWNGNDKQRFFVDIYLNNDWYPQCVDMQWEIYIGCNQGLSIGIEPSLVSHRLSPVECFSMGWIFHTPDRRFQGSISQQGLKRQNRDALHFMYENDGSPGYVKKGAGTREPRRYDNNILCGVECSCGTCLWP